MAVEKVVLHTSYFTSLLLVGGGKGLIAHCLLPGVK